MKVKKQIEITSFKKSNNYRNYIILLVCISFFLFANTLNHGYNVDDNLVTQNHFLTSKKEISTIVDIFTSPYYVDNMGYSYGYRPIVTLSFFIEHYLFGEKAGISHFFNVILYILAVLLFFKLLIKLFGEKGLVFALFSAIFFAIHPTHSEVVASIKNRDEILAFLFSILAALAIIKYLEKKTWYTLFVISAVFALGMLSKKSIYPMVIILPIAIVLFQDLELKQFFFISMALIIPAAIVGSNLEIEKFTLLFCLPCVGIVLMYLLKIRNKIVDSIKRIYDTCKSYDIYIYSVLSWVFIVMSIWKQDYGYFLLSIPCLLFVIKKNEYWFVIQLIIQFAFIGYFFKLSDILFIDMVVCIGYATSSILNKKTVWKILILSTVVLLLFISTNFHLFGFIIPVFTILFFYFFFKKVLWGLFVLDLIIVLLSVLFNFGLPQFLVLILSVFPFVNSTIISQSIISYSKIILLLLCLIYVTIIDQKYSLPIWNSNSTIVLNDKPIAETIPKNTYVAKGFIKENRPIEYVENSLIVPHSKSETIGTGFFVLGTYLKLMTFPKELSFYYGYSKIKTIGINNWSVLLSILIHLCLILLAIWQMKKRPVLTFGVLWYFISILLFSNWPELVAGMVGERLAFTASAGFAIFIGSLVVWLKPDFSFTKPKGLDWVVFSVLVMYSIRTFSRNAEWKDSIILMGNDIKHLGNSAQANNLYATYLMKESVNPKNSPEAKRNYQNLALTHFHKAVKVYPAFFNANFDIARVNIELQDFGNAKIAFEQSYKIDPENMLVLEELTKTSFDLKQKSDTEYYGNKYIEKDKNNENIHELVAYIMFINNEKIKAKEYAERGLIYFPNNKNLQGILLESSKSQN